MNIPFVLILVLVLLAAWAVVSFFLVRINQQARQEKQTKTVQPAFRLADQWIMESQRKIEQLIERAEGPLGTAQSELLELRLEASRLPQGVKNLRNIREALTRTIRPTALQEPLSEIAGLYLNSADIKLEATDMVHLASDQGLIPVLETPISAALTDGAMKGWLKRLSAQANPVMGGFLYFANTDHFKVLQANREWTDALRNYRLLALDFNGLTALLISLKLTHETNRLIQVFEAGVQSTVPLVGQSDKMGAALTALGASVLNAQTIMDGGVPTPNREKEGKA